MGAPVALRETAAKARDAINSLDMAMQYVTVSKIEVADWVTDRTEELLHGFEAGLAFESSIWGADSLNFRIVSTAEASHKSPYKRSFPFGSEGFDIWRLPIRTAVGTRCGRAEPR